MPRNYRSLLSQRQSRLARADSRCFGDVADCGTALALLVLCGATLVQILEQTFLLRFALGHAPSIALTIDHACEATHKAACPLVTVQPYFVYCDCTQELAIHHMSAAVQQPMLWGNGIRSTWSVVLFCTTEWHLPDFTTWMSQTVSINTIMKLAKRHQLCSQVNSG